MYFHQHIKRIFTFVVTFALGFSITVAQANISKLPFYWDFMNVDIEVQENGDMLVSETQKYVFNQPYKNQRYRYIPLDKVDDIKDVTVEENGQVLPSQVGKKNNQLWIRWQHELNPPESHTFILKYRVVGGLHVNGEQTQVYWKAIFADRSSPIQAARVRVKLPEALSRKVLDYKAFGSAEARQLDVKTFEFTANQALQPRQELEVQVSFPSDVLNISKPRWQQFNSSEKKLVISPAPSNSLEQQPEISPAPSNSSDKQLEVSSLLICFLLFFIVIGGSVIIKGRRCPECKRFNLRRNTIVLVSPTKNTTGKQWVIDDCMNCDYHHVYEETIPVISYSSGGYGGAASGGGSGGGGGGGGGGCGGGGGGCGGGGGGCGGGGGGCGGGGGGGG